MSDSQKKIPPLYVRISVQVFAIFSMLSFPPSLLNNIINTDNSCRAAALVTIRKKEFLPLLQNSLGTKCVVLF